MTTNASVQQKNEHFLPITKNTYYYLYGPSIKDFPRRISLFSYLEERKKTHGTEFGREKICSKPENTLFSTFHAEKTSRGEYQKKNDVLMVVLNQACTQPHTNLFNIICPHLTL